MRRHIQGISKLSLGGEGTKPLDVGSQKVANLKFIAGIGDFCCPFKNCIVKLPVLMFCTWPNFLFANSEIYINVTTDLFFCFVFVFYLSTLKGKNGIHWSGKLRCNSPRHNLYFVIWGYGDFTDIITSSMHCNVLVSFAMELDFTHDWTNEFKREMAIFNT